MNALQLAAGDFQVPRLFRAAAQQDAVIVAGESLHRDVDAHVRVGHKSDAFGPHLMDAAVQNMLFEFEVGDAIAHQAADAVVLLVDRHRVPGAAQLLCGGQSRRSAADHGHPLAGVRLRRLGMNPAFVPPALHDGALHQLDRHRGLVDAQHAGGLARGGADATCELGKVVGGVQAADGGFPAAVIRQVVPVRNQVVHRTAGMAERNAAVHAARALLALLFLGEGLVNLQPVLKPVLDFAPGGLFAIDLQKPCHLTHAAPLLPPPEATNLWERNKSLRRAEHSERA